MICSSVNLLFFMSIILLVDGLHYLYAGTAGRGQVSPVDVVLISRRQQTLGPTAFTHLGVPLHEARVIGVKSSHHYYAGFSPLSSDCRVIETGAALSMDFAQLPYRQRDRDFFPAVDNPAPQLA